MKNYTDKQLRKLWNDLMLLSSRTDSRAVSEVLSIIEKEQGRRKEV